MDIIERIANQIFTTQIQRGPKPHSEVMSLVKSKIYDINSKNDQIKFLDYLLKNSVLNFSEHMKVCTSPETCRKNFEYESIIFYLQQELIKLGIILDENTFTDSEIISAESKLEEVLEELKKVKLGQEIIYEDLTKEIDELKSYFFLGKKNWYQLFAGKIVDMTVSGIVSETASKQIIEIFKSNLKHLL